MSVIRVVMFCVIAAHPVAAQERRPSLMDSAGMSGNEAAAITSYLKSYELDPGNERALREANRLRNKR